MTDLVERLANILAGHFYAVGVQMEGPLHGLRPDQKRKCMDAAIVVKETVLEEAAKVAEGRKGYRQTNMTVAASIRALGDKP